MPTDLSPAEKDDRQVERLINKKPPPSRKHRPKRGPKHDNRRRRMIDVNDPDVKAARRDRKSSLADIALRVAFPGEPRAGAASYGGDRGEVMSPKTAAYHGVVQQGHPSGPTNTGYNSYDKRYFGKAEYDSIVAHAKELLKTDWLSHGWDGGAEDAPVRAALDMAIHLADSNLYQGKIDGETYNMLLARLTSSEADLFSDTLVPEGGEGKRSAATMNNTKTVPAAVADMVRIANDLRKTNPRAAFEIIRNIRNLRVAQVPVESQVRRRLSADSEACGKTSALQKGGPNVKDVKHQLDLFSQARSGEELIDVLTKITESVKTAGSRIAASALEELAPIADMSDEEIMKLVQSGKRDVAKLEEVLEGFGDSESLSPEEVEAFVKGVDDFINGILGEAEKLKTASVAVPISTLLRVAGISPEAKLVMMPYLVAAKKKVEKAKKKGKKKGKKAPPKVAPAPKGEGGKKGPAKGKASPFGKKKASFDITSVDLKW